MTPDEARRLEQAWVPAREAGALGSDVETLARHAGGFFPPGWDTEAPFRALDLGTGVGVPGIFLALRSATSTWLLVEAAERRAEWARAAVRAVGLSARVDVWTGRAEALAADQRGVWDFVTARLAGDIALVAEVALPLLVAGGVLVVSVNEASEARFESAPLGDLGVARLERWHTPAGRFLGAWRSEDSLDGWPRRLTRMRDRPLF